MPPRRAALLLALLALAAGLVLRVPGLSVEELSTDEAFSWRLSRHEPAAIVARTAADVHPPLYYLVVHGWTRLFGDSAAALRGLSLLCGTAVVLLAWPVGREVPRALGGPESRAAPLAAALVIALHADQVGHSRHARMYALGGALAGLSTWLLLRALRPSGPGARGRAFWLAYALVAAALCYTHYYGVFTVAAQLAAAAVVLARRGPAASAARTGLPGWALAVVLLAVLLVPWAPTVLGQTRRVSGSYWIGEQGVPQVAAALLRWATGLEWASPAPGVVIALFAAAAAWALVGGDAGQRFLAAQAVLPWAGAFVLSAAAGRPLFLERYLAFAQFALVVLLAHTWARARRGWVRSGTAALYASAIALGLAHELAARPSGEGAAVQGARVLAAHARADDLVLANAPRDLMVLDYYLRRVGAGHLDVRTLASRSSGHLSQVAAIDAGEVIEDARVWDGPWRQVWFVRVHPTRRWRPEPPPPGWETVFTRVFEGAGSTRLLLVAFERRPPPTSQ